MKKVTNLIVLYNLGHQIGQVALRANHPSETAIGILPTCALVRTELVHLLQDETLPFETSRAPASRTINAIDAIMEECRRANNDILLTGIPNERRELLAAMTELEITLAHEMDAMPIWFVTPCRGYSTDILIQNAEHIFGESEIRLLSSKTIADIREAGRAIAFELITAVGFHSVRAVEAVARGYHEIILGAKTSEGTPLGPLINALRNERDSLIVRKLIDKDDPLNLVIDFLTRINNIYRKPITHPDMVLEPRQALAVFESAKCAISLMLEDAEKKNKAGIPLGFF